ncbi:MAG: hypothetical protein FWG20_04560, partial [Candidatus Cloacimonetes bacterium]|nr:hypothetical protein [Candidatus Cloacimonadota bacterium]
MREKKKAQVLYNFIHVLAAILLLNSCFAGSSMVQRSARVLEVDKVITVAGYQAGVEQIKQAQASSYPIYDKQNAVSLFLDKGQLEFYAGDYESSIASLLNAERLISEAYTKSISEGVASYILNDNTKEYPGEDFENIYVNVFGALNYYRLGDIEKALVEVRRVNEKLVYIRDNYEVLNARRSTQRADSIWGKRIHYTNSALARYLGMLFWRGIGNSDSARIDAEELTAAYEASPEIYYNPLPPELIMQDRSCEELSIPRGMARINVLSFTGLSPLKTPVNTNEWRYRTYYTYSNVLTDPFAGLLFRQSPVDKIEVVFDDGRTVNLSLLEDMGSVVQQVYQSRSAHIEDRKIALNLMTGAFLLTDSAKIGQMFLTWT